MIEVTDIYAPYSLRPNNALHPTPVAAVSYAWHYAVQATVAGELWR